MVRPRSGLTGTASASSESACEMCKSGPVDSHPGLGVLFTSPTLEKEDKD